MKRRLLAKLLASMAVCFGTTVYAAIGPTQTSLKITSMYAIGGSNAIYVSFQSGAMPGCYGSSGGYLYTSNTLFKEIYAQLLMIAATGGIQASVVFTQNVVTNNWSDCTIDGIYLIPQ